jgi:hypothetical protein
LGDHIGQIKPYGKILLGVALLLAAVYFGTSYVAARNRQAQQAAWSAYYDATATGDPQEFRKVADSYPGTIASGWALQSAGDLYLNQGVGQLFQNRAEARKQLTSAREAYEAVAESFDDPMLKQRALFGWAKALESMGELSQAEKHYSEVAERYGDSEFGKMAAERLAELKKPAAQQWYNWFAEQKPQATPLNDPSLFQDLPNLPEKPDISMPKPGELLGPDSAKGHVLDQPPGTPAPADSASPSLPTDGVLPGTSLDIPGDSGAQPTLVNPAPESPAGTQPGAKLDLDLPPETPDNGTLPTNPDN